jgi:hypothetical protein
MDGGTGLGENTDDSYSSCINTIDQSFYESVENYAAVFSVHSLNSSYVNI